MIVSDRAAGEPTSLRAVLTLADRLLAAIGAGHRQRSPGLLVHGAVHHDAVRARLAEGREPEVRVIDFGLSAEKDSSALAALVDANPSEYAAPEHAREPALRTPAADVFAAAVLIVRMLVPEALLVGLAGLAGVLAFILGVMASSREPAAPATVAPTVR